MVRMKLTQLAVGLFVWEGNMTGGSDCDLTKKTILEVLTKKSTPKNPETLPTQRLLMEVQG